MAWGTTQGIQTPFPYQNANVVPQDVFRMAIDYYPNRAPLFSRLAKLPLGALTFYCNNETYRPRTTTLTAAYTSTGATLTVADTTGIDVGDILEIDSERMIVTSINNATVLSVTTAYEGTSNVNHNNNSTVTIVTNARTGGEVDQNAMSRLPNAVAQYAQTIHHSYQVGGSLQSTANFMDGQVTPLDRDRQICMQHVVDDAERAMYYGKGAVLSSTVTRQTMKGLQTLLSTNNDTSATNGSAYKPSDFIGDTIQKIGNNGGEPTLALVSMDFLTGMHLWGWNLQQIPAQATALGIMPTSLTVPILGSIQLVPAPLLATGTAIVLDTKFVRVRVKRPLIDYPRGRRGDVFEGDMICELSIEVENETQAGAFVSGITGFAKET